MHSSTGTSPHGQRVVQEVTTWPGISTRPAPFGGGIEFVVKGRAIGHVHVEGESQADIPFPRAIRDQLVAESRTGPHHIYPDSTWTTRPIHSAADADEVVDLFRINYDRVISGKPVPDDPY